jgi:hypothetical protein
MKAEGMSVRRALLEAGRRTAPTHPDDDRSGGDRDAACKAKNQGKNIRLIEYCNAIFSMMQTPERRLPLGTAFFVASMLRYFRCSDVWAYIWG